MKKISLYLAAACAIFGMASCSQDRDPVLQTPTEFVLNTPVLQDQFIQLQAGNTLELVASQPNYGYSAVANYSAQMSLTGDFTNEEEIYDLVPTNPTHARMNIKQEHFASCICALHGVTNEETFDQVFPNGMSEETIYFRAVCELSGVAGTRIVSNVVTYNKIKGYFAVPVPGWIYLVGKPEGWAGPEETNASHYAPWRLFEPEDGIGSKIYKGTFDIPADIDGEQGAIFRFYTELSGWDGGDSYGSQVEDNPIDFPWNGSDGDFNNALVKGKGSFSFPNWPGGKMTIIVDMSDPKNMTVTMMAGEGGEIIVPKYIYMMGSLQGWSSPCTGNEAGYQDWRLVDRSNSGIYTGKFNVPAGKWYVRFAYTLSDGEGDEGWGNPDQWGSQLEDGDVDAALTNGVFTAGLVNGKGNYVFDFAEATTVDVTVDTNVNSVTIAQVAQ
ncbi:MAG: SusE domain-containing protein [Muribaculaceae bacterium]|nr:SusE domain-containing protein [Muribaculaceae bacterium]